MAELSPEKRRLVAVMCLDMAGYSARMSRNEKLALSLVTELENILRSEIPVAGGRLVKLMGDGSLAEFPTAVAAVSCSRAILKRLVSRNNSSPASERFEVRIGLNLGEVVEKDDDIFGDAVNIAARLQPIADPGGIAMSEAVYSQVRNQTPLSGLFCLAKLKNIPGKVNVFLLPPSGVSVILWRLNRRAGSLILGAAVAVVTVGLALSGIWMYHNNISQKTPDETLLPVTTATVPVTQEDVVEDKLPDNDKKQEVIIPAKSGQALSEEKSPKSQEKPLLVKQPAQNTNLTPALVQTAVPPQQQAVEIVAENTPVLEVQVNGILTVGGEIGVAVFNQKTGYPIQIEHAYEAEWVALEKDQTSVTVEFDSLPDGEYAVSVMHDENGNRKLERSGVGFPKEGVGFSNDQRVTLKAPGYEKSKFTLSSGERRKIIVQLDYRHRPSTRTSD